MNEVSAVGSSVGGVVRYVPVVKSRYGDDNYNNHNYNGTDRGRCDDATRAPDAYLTARVAPKKHERLTARQRSRS